MSRKRITGLFYVVIARSLFGGGERETKHGGDLGEASRCAMLVVSEVQVPRLSGSRRSRSLSQFTLLFFPARTFFRPVLPGNSREDRSGPAPCSPSVSRAGDVVEQPRTGFPGAARPA